MTYKRIENTILENYDFIFTYFKYNFFRFISYI